MSERKSLRARASHGLSDLRTGITINDNTCTEFRGRVRGDGAPARLSIELNPGCGEP